MKQQIYRLIGCAALFYKKQTLFIALCDCKITNTPSPEGGRKCPVTILLIKLIKKKAMKGPK